METTPQTTDAIVSIVERIVIALLGGERDFEVVARHGHGRTSISVKAAPRNIPKLIGKQGRTVQALRTIVASMGKQQRYTLDISERPHTNSSVQWPIPPERSDKAFRG